MGPSARENDIEQLRLLLARDWQATKSLLEQQISTLPQDQQSALRGMMLRQDLNYRYLIAMLDMAGAPGWPPFWITEPPRSRQ